jgi:hypothetical protein
MDKPNRSIVHTSCDCYLERGQHSFCASQPLELLSAWGSGGAGQAVGPSRRRAAPHVVHAVLAIRRACHVGKVRDERDFHVYKFRMTL